MHCELENIDMKMLYLYAQSSETQGYLTIKTCPELLRANGYIIRYIDHNTISVQRSHML